MYLGFVCISKYMLYFSENYNLKNNTKLPEQKNFLYC